MFEHTSFVYVEDDALSRQVMEMIMRAAMGAQTLNIFEDSSNLLSRLKALPQRPDVIMLDVHVKPHDGFEMLNMLRGDPNFDKIRVIALTASVMNEEVHQLRASGFDGAIAKPLSVTTFPGLIERVLRGETIWSIA